MNPPTIYRDLLAEAPIPARGIHSQTVSDAGGIELVLFAFAAGEQLSEHTSARPAILHVLAGSGSITAADERVDAGPGTWVRIAAGTVHAVVADTPMVMALYLLPA